MTKTITHGDFTWTGRNLTEARELRDAQLDRFLRQENFEPTVVQHGTHALVVFPQSPTDWAYTINGRAYCGGHASRAQAERRGRFHLAQMIFDVGDSTSMGFDVIKDEEDRKDHLRWVAFQQRYAALRAEHPELGHHELHRLACEAA